jgi:hypothetical protein
MDDQEAGLSHESKKFIILAFSLLMVVYFGLGFLVDGKYISPVLFAILGGLFMAIVVAIIAYVVIHNDGWGVIFPP